MPPLKSSAAFHEQRRSSERVRRKCRSRPEQSELIQMHVLAEKASDVSPSCNEDSKDSVSPEQSSSRFPLVPQTLTGGTLLLAPTQVPLSNSHLPSFTGAIPPPKHRQADASAQRMAVNAQTKAKPNSDRSAQRHKKLTDNGPKIKKLKYHQYIPPDHKEDKECPPSLDSSYTNFVQQQQQLFLQLQNLSQQQQQQHYSHHSILSAPLIRPHKDQLYEMKVAELKSELKLRSLPVYGTKNDLIERLRTYDEENAGSDITSSPTAGGTTGPGAEGGGKSSLTGEARNSATPPTVAQLLMTCSSSIPPPPVSLTRSDHSLAAKSSEDTSFNSNPLGEMMSSPLAQVYSAAQLSTNIKEEPSCFSPAPCQFSLKQPSLKKQCVHTTTATAPVLTSDKDKMLREKDKEIEELMRMLRQKQRLVDLLRMQLEHEKKEELISDPVVLVRVKQEPPVMPSSPLSDYHALFHPPLFTSCETNVAQITIKQEAIEAEEAVPETTLRSPDAHELQQFLTRERIPLQIKTEQTKKEKHVCLQQTTLQWEKLLTRRRSIQTQQRVIEAHGRMLENQQNLQELYQHKETKSHKQQQKPLKPNQHTQQMQLEQQILAKQKNQQQENKQPQQIQKHINLKQQNVLIQQNPQVWQPQAHKRGLQVSEDQQQAVSQSVLPSLRPFFKHQETVPAGENSLSPSSQTEAGSSLDVLFSPLSPASIRMPDKDTEREDDFIDVILQTGETSTTFNPVPDLSLDCLHPDPWACPSPSPLQLSQSRPVPPSYDAMQPVLKEKRPLCDAGSGRLEDFLESTTGNPLLGVEPGDLLALIDDLHNQMLCTPSILDHPPSPMDFFDRSADVRQKLSINEWLDLSTGAETDEETHTQTPCGVFSTDFLDKYMMQYNIHY